MPAQVLLAGAGLFLLGALGSYHDIRHRRLPNWLCLLTFVSGMTFGALSGGVGLIAQSLAHSAIAIIIGMVLFNFRWIGGGDAKYYAAMAAWFSIYDGMELLFAVSVSGLILILVWFATRQLTRTAAPVRNDGPFSKLPYGVAISLGGLFAFFALRA